MASVRSVTFLPEIFQTTTNKQFLSATLDQLTQEPDFKKIQGFVGRSVGPGVNPNDSYIKESTATRANYQLEPGVIVKKEESSEIKDAITFPGITDALLLQGSPTGQSDRLYTSDYYTWDPFVDFDKFVNYSQYYWLPDGPASVNVFAETVPTTENFVVTRENGVYTFSGVASTNPDLTLVRQGNYTFQVAQNAKETINFRVTNLNNTAYKIDYQNNPTLTLVRGNTYVFDLSIRGEYRFWIKTAVVLGTNMAYNDGVTNNGAFERSITFVVPQDAPDTLYYTSETEFSMNGRINIVDADAGTGPGFWIQTDPGISGRIPASPNISSRDVLGVFNNGEDLGTVQFNVPTVTAQDFYYNLTDLGIVNLVTTSLKFNQVNNIYVSTFLEEHGGIDGITTLNGLTIVFTNPINDPEDGGWQITTQYDPLDSGAANEGLDGSYDTTTYDQTTDITSQAQRYSIWQIQYVNDTDGEPFMRLNSIRDVANLSKFSINYGTEYSTTQWYKNAEGYFQQIPLLTATKDVLFYQDGTDPGIFGRIRLIEQSSSSTLDIDDILGKTNYTSPNGVVFSNGLKVQFIGEVTPSSYQNNEYYIEGVGTGIKLLPVTNFVTPEESLQDTTGDIDSSLNQPIKLDYLTINRASEDLNAWTRSNRWFHIDIISSTATYNNTVPELDNNQRARRPVLEFRAGTRLFNFGTNGKQPIDVIDFTVTDALSTINGSLGYGFDGYTFTNGTRVVFAADADPDVRNKIYEVEFITIDSVDPLIAQPILNLVPAEDADVLVDQTVVCLSGNTLRGRSFWFDGITWQSAQQKFNTNQAPLFDIYDLAGISFGNTDQYPSSTFTGSKLFSYAVGTGTPDPVLQFALKYLSLTNVGDIVFDNNFYNDTFIYVDNNVSNTKQISEGLVREYSDRTTYVKELGWQKAKEKSRARQQFKFIYDGAPLLFDVRINDDTEIPAVQLYIGATFIAPSQYYITKKADSSTITLLDTYAIGDVIEAAVISDQISKVGFYQVPINLENNPLNQNNLAFTLGTIRSHYETIGENLIALSGKINGANNIRDLGNVIPYGTNILQQSAPLTLAGYFMRSQDYDIFGAIDFNSREYTKFKNQLLDTVVRNDYGSSTIAEILDSALFDINDGRTNINSFYWSDMLPYGSVYTETVTVCTSITIQIFDLSTTYDFTSSNYKGLLVYRNDELLLIDYDYTVATDGPRLTIIPTLEEGDVITIREYESTTGNFVPNTPTKLGLYPAFKPEIFLDDTYSNPTLVIRGHDGSITVAFDDFRDSILLEFETRIFNNLKIKSAIPLPLSEVVPGQFRETDYTLAEINEILATDFLSWIGWSKLNYTAQTYIEGNEFTWNYSSSGNKLTGETSNGETPLLGAWRGIYRYFYDTDSPHSTPWQMLGFSQEPSWWESIYGPAPYTQDNLVLWDDLALGRVADPAGEYFLPQYVRPRLTEVIPAGTEGQLLSPFDSVVGQYDSLQFRKSWVFGDGGPVESSWYRSSSYPFAAMRLLALTRPAEFFALFADRDLYKFDIELDQYLYNNRYRLDANGLEIYGSGESKASYINWIVDYNQITGRSSAEQLSLDLASLDVRLCYRMAAFTDKQYLKIYSEKSSPNSQNSSLLLPDESFQLLLYKNQPFAKISYSSIIVQKVDDGYAVLGYSINRPYYEILASRPGGLKRTISAGNTSVVVPTQYSNDVVQVPYGYVFANPTMVVDFILSYGELLKTQGMLFDGVENGYQLNWPQMASEFLYWSTQGWSTGAIVGLNPAAGELSVIKEQAIVDSIATMTQENLVMDQNRTTIPARDLVINRDENKFTVRSLSSQTISYLDVKFTSYESIIVLDNISIFNDLIYSPATGARQGRINVVAAVSANWNGQLDAKGFILNNTATVKEWVPNQKYTKGEIVLYKNNYWSAQDIVQPSATFKFEQWVKSDYTKIQRGMLPNIPNKSNQLASSYDTNLANLEQDNDLLSYGLIGFRPRDYMTSLNLNDVSQVNVYQQFLKTKGTKQSIDLFSGAKLSKESAQYDVFEYWAIQRAIYGANANQSFVEFRLNESLLQADPAVIAVVAPQEESKADQTILINDIWRESYNITSTDILPTTLITPTDIALPTAGYVNIDDVDITVFSIEDQLALAPGVIDTIGIGTTIWAAKSNSHDWNIYRCNKVPGKIKTISSNLDGTATVTFTETTNLSEDDIVVIRFTESTSNGIYRVISAENVNSIVIALTATDNPIGVGLAYVLQSQRVQQPSDVSALPYALSLVPGARAWVDSNSNGNWEVLEKTDPFSSDSSITPSTLVIDGQFGASLSQAQNNVSALIGSPGLNSTGAIYTYLRDENSNYIEVSILTLGVTGTEGYGNAVEIGSNSWAVAGASKSNGSQGYASVIFRDPASNIFEQRQVLLAPDQNFGTTEFGFAVAMSTDERWMYVSAPAANKVYAYGRVDVDESQFVRYTTDGVSTSYNYSDSIIVDFETQLSVVLNNSLLTLGVDYTVNANNIFFAERPVAGLPLIIQRKNAIQLDQGAYYDVPQDATSGTGTDALFTVERTRGEYSVSLTSFGTGYAPGDTITIYAATVDGGTSPTNDITITVLTTDSGSIETISSSGVGVTNTAIFEIEPFLYTVSDIFSFTITVDGVLQRPYMDYDFNNDSALEFQNIVFNTIPAAGAIIIVSAKTYFQFVEALTVTGLASDARFGASLSTTTDGRQIVIGASNDDGSLPNSGTVYVIDRSVTRTIISDTLELTYELPATFQDPVSVKLNGVFLENKAQFTPGGFSVVGFDVVLDSDLELAIGDVLEIESNVFKQVQTFEAAEPSSFSKFGDAVDMCPNNCSIYIGSPDDGLVLPKAGSVNRRVNQARLYGVISSTVANPTLDNGDTIRVNGVEVAVPNAPNQNVAGLAAAINAAAIPNVQASENAGILTISIIDIEAATDFNKLSILPGIVGTAFADLGFDTYAYTQTLYSPRPTDFANFGASLVIDSHADNLVVGAPGGTLFEPVTYDENTTYFDDYSTTTFSSVTQSGAVYTFDKLSASNESIVNPSKFVFGQQIYDTSVMPLDQWGTSVSYVSGRLLIGSPGNDVGDSSGNYGRIGVFNNTEQLPAWAVIHEQQPVVDVRLLDSVYLFNKLKSAETHYLDFINPLQGKILGAARQNIDFIGAVDPANYNVGTTNNNGNYWGTERVGQIWWNTNSVRFIDPNQDDIVYASRRWAQVFPGSKVEIYQWIESAQPPALYTGQGTPLSASEFTSVTRLSSSGIIVTSYYFWVAGLDTVNTNAGKTLGTTSIARYIENPKSSGIPYLAPINASTVAIYNSLEFISAEDTILHIEYDQELTDDNVHVEYELIAQGRPESFLSAGLYRKLQDSFCGVNTTGAIVPDPTLTVAEKIGIQFRPRQSMFENRFTALKNYLTRVNAILKNYPIVESRRFSLLNSSELPPTAMTGAWDKQVANLEELSYQNLSIVPVGYNYLVDSDSDNDGLWTIYTVAYSPIVTTEKITTLTRVQNYDTRKYWNYIDWYSPTYNSSIAPSITVPNYSALATVSVQVGKSAKVASNAQGKFEIYLNTETGWVRVGLQDGTIAFDEELWDYSVGRFGFDLEVFDAQYFDKEPSIETRKIIQAINEELLIDDLLIERNNVLILMFQYILTESSAPEWLVKTSLIDVEHRIRELIPFQTYKKDNQEFVLDYIQEVKPYHVQIREFNIVYNGLDAYLGDATDFDIPSYYAAELEVPQYISPVLLPYTGSTATGTGTINTVSDASVDADVWTKAPWTYWFNNYTLGIEGVEIVNSGSGYTEVPQVVITGVCTTPATMTAVINSFGEVTGVIINDPGVGYLTTATIAFEGGNGSGASAVTIMGNSLVRSIKTTIKYDRYQYVSTIVDWEANVVYLNGTQVRQYNQVWEANSTTGPSVVSSTFEADQWLLVDPDTLSGVDRTMGLYTPTVNQPGLRLPLLIDGVEYPGVQIQGPNFNQNSGFDVGNYDINVYDNLSYGPEGKPTYDPAILNAIYESEYTDIYLGTRTTDVNVDGGQFVDRYNGYSPEELVNGSEFDTLDFRVYTRPGADWENDGHGFRMASMKYVFVLGEELSFVDALPYPITISLINQTQQTSLIQTVNYTVDWIDQSITVTSGANTGDTLALIVNGLGGGNQLYRNNYAGTIIGDSVTIPVLFTEIQEMAIFVNGDHITDYSISASGLHSTLVTFGNNYTSSDYIALTAIGVSIINGEEIDYGWSTQLRQLVPAVTGVYSYAVTNALTYSNPDNLIVSVSGTRARTPAGAEYFGDGSTAYLCPDRLGISQGDIVDTDVHAYINDIPQVYGVDYVVEAWDGINPRAVIFAVAPALGERVLITVATGAQCVIDGSNLVFDPLAGLVPVTGDTIVITTWNDTRQQNLITKVFVGPTTESVVVQEAYDSTDFDTGTITGAAGTFDYADGAIITVNDIQLGRVITDTSRLIVSRNGRRIFFGDGFTILGEELVLTSGILGPTDKVMVTMMTESTVPEAMAFRIFQDMRKVQATYRITADTTTTLVQTLADVDDVIYVNDASVLAEPDLEANIWGIISIGGERIMYRNRDTSANTLSGLRRGTAGTGAATHDINSLVYDMGGNNLLEEQFQNFVKFNTFESDGTTETFVASNLVFELEDSTIVDEAVEVYIGGELQLGGYLITGDNPVTVEFDTAPESGLEIVILVRQGTTWYEPGEDTASNGVALQDTNTQAARFLKGE